MELMQNPNNLAALLQGGSSLLSLFAPKKGTSTVSGGTQTQQTNMTQEGLDAVLRQILEGNSGLASVARGQRGAGLYNSSTNQLLLNDLITRASGEVAKINAPTTVTRSPQVTQTNQEAPLGIGTALGTVALGTIANNLIKELGNSGGSSAVKGLGGAAGTGILAGSSGEGFKQIGDIFSMGGGTSAGFGDVLGGGLDASSFMADFGGSLGSAGGPVNIASTVAGLFGPDPGAALERGIGTAVGSIFGPAGAAIGGAVAEPIFEVGYDVLGGIEQLGGNLIEGVGDVISGIFGGGCFITTATCKAKGKPDNCDELETLRAFRDGWLKQNHPEAIQQYYDIAPALVDKISEQDEPQEILDAIYDNYIVPAVQAVKEGKNQKAYEIYTQMVLTVSKLTESEAK